MIGRNENYMSIITFVNDLDETTGKSLAVAAISTSMAVNYNMKILVVSTTHRDDKLAHCFYDSENTQRTRIGLFGMTRNSIDTEQGIEGLAKIARSNKVSPNVITDYTKVILKDRLEVLAGKKFDPNNPDVPKIDSEYIEIVSEAASYYDNVMVDLDRDISEETRKRILEISNVIVVVSSQNKLSLAKIRDEKQTNELFQSPKTLILIGRFDKFSKYSKKDIRRFLGEKNDVLTVPYNTRFMEASNEAGVVDYFLNYRMLKDTEDTNYLFIQEVKNASENIAYRLKELQAMR